MRRLAVRPGRCGHRRCECGDASLRPMIEVVRHREHGLAMQRHQIAKNAKDLCRGHANPGCRSVRPREWSEGRSPAPVPQPRAGAVRPTIDPVSCDGDRRGRSDSSNSSARATIARIVQLPSSARIGSATFSVMREFGKQKVKLKDEAEPRKPNFRAFVIRHAGRSTARRSGLRRGSADQAIPADRAATICRSRTGR